MVLFKREANKLKQSGFTLLEMVITLAISIGLLTFGSLYLDGYKKELILENTVKEVKGELEQAARISTIKHQSSYISYFPSAKVLMISRAGEKKELKIDPSIKIYNLGNFKISANGSIKPQTITIGNNQHERKIRVQMTWGRMIND